MNVRECLKTINHLLEGLENEETLTEKEKQEYGYESDWYDDKKYYDKYRVKNYIALERSERQRITKTMLKEMKKFLEKAQKMGFRGKVRFRNGYDNGMWASTRDYDQATVEATKGQIVLYHSFETDSNYWQLLNEKGNRIGNTCNTEKEIKELVKNYSEGKV